jgi:hypothetical protein
VEELKFETQINLLSIFALRGNSIQNPTAEDSQSTFILGTTSTGELQAARVLDLILRLRAKLYYGYVVKDDCKFGENDLFLFSDAKERSLSLSLS